MPDNDRFARSVVNMVNRLRRQYANERRRIARELHDKVAHSLSVALNSLELYQIYRTEDPSRAQTHLHNAVRAVHRSLERVHELSSDLRTREVDDGLDDALSDYLRMVAPPTVAWTVTVSGDDARLPADTRDELYLILREAAHNSLIHSAARHIDIHVDIGADAVRATAADDGCGFDLREHPSTGGLTAMRERALLLGGRMELSSRSDAGTVAQVHVPLHGTPHQLGTS